MSKGYSPNSWYRNYFWLFKGLLQYRIRNSKDTKASWNNGCCLKNRKIIDVLHVEITYHLKRGCSKKTLKNLQKSALAAIEKMHWAKECKPKFDIKEKPIPENSKQETSQVPFNKNQGQIPSFPSNPQHPAALPSIYQP